MIARCAEHQDVEIKLESWVEAVLYPQVYEEFVPNLMIDSGGMKLLALTLKD